jgi:hypothetical protein
VRGGTLGGLVDLHQAELGRVVHVLQAVEPAVVLLLPAVGGVGDLSDGGGWASELRD